MENHQIKEQKKKPSFLVILLLIIDLALLAVIVTSAADKKETDTSKPSVAEAFSGDKKQPGQGLSEKTEAENAPDEADPPDTQPQAADGAESTAEIENAENTENKEAFRVSDYSTTVRPSLSDFMWYFDGVYWNGIPQEATYIYDSEQLVGDWKGFVLYDPDRKMNSYAVEFLNVNLDIRGQAANVVFDLYEIYFEGMEPVNEESGPSLHYSGSFEAGTVYAAGGGNVHIDSFYTLSDGRQYAVGYLDTPDGTPAFLALVRP